MRTRFCIRTLVVAAFLAAANLTVALPMSDQLQLPDSPARALQQEGVEALAKGDLSTADSKFRAAAAADPKAPAPLLGLAEAAMLRGDLALAETEINKALTLSPNSSIAHTYRGRYLVGRHDYQSALQEFDKAISLDAKAVEPLVAKGDVLAFAVNDKKAALETYHAAIRVDSQNARAHYGLGSVLMETGQLAEAKTEFTQVTHLAPKNSSAWLSLGAVATNMNDLNAALSAFDKAAVLDPKSAPPQVARGDIFVMQGKADAAISAYSEALRLEPRTPTALIRRGLMEEKLKRYVEAEKDYRTAIAIDTKDSLATNNLAFMLAEQKRNLDEALSLAQKATKAMPKNTNYMDTLAWVHHARGELPQAVAILQPLADKMKNPDMLFHLGVIYGEMGKKADALAAFDKTLSLSPNYQPAQTARAQLKGS